MARRQRARIGLQKRHQIGLPEAPLPPPADAQAREAPAVGPAAQGRFAYLQQRRCLRDVEQLGIERHEFRHRSLDDQC